MRRIAALALLAVLGLSAGTATAQTVPTQGLPARFIAAFPGAGVETTALLGAYVKSITPAGVATVQLDDESETTVTLTAGGGGATITTGTADPTGGSAGDVYFQVDGSNEIQSVWLNVMGTWTEYAVPTAGTSTDDQTAAEVNTDTTNFGNNLSNTDTTVQAALDTLDNLNVGGGGGTDDQTAAEVNTTTTNFDGHLSNTDTTVQAALDTLDDAVSQSDAAASNVSTGASAAGTSDDVSRADHVHGSAADVHTTTTSVTQGTDPRIFTLTGLTPALTTPVVGTTLVFKTPAVLTTSAMDGVFLRIGTTNYNMNRPPGLAIRVATLAANTPYVVVFDGSDFELLDTTLGIPRGGADNQVLRKTSGADYAVAWEDESGGGLNQNEVDARITALRPNVFTATAQTTQDTNSFVIATLRPTFTNPDTGYTVIFVTPTTIADGGSAMLRINGVDRALRFPGNLEVDIEAFKTQQTYIAVFDGGNYEVIDNNVQADWNETTTTADSFIRNKPTIPDGDITGVAVTAPITGGGTDGDLTIGISPATGTAPGSMSAADKVKLDGLEDQIELIDSVNDVTYTQDDPNDLSTRFGGNNAYVADIDAEGTGDAEINDLIVFQWRDDPSAVPDARQLGIRINQTGTTLPIRIVDPLTNTLVNKTVADLTRYEFLFLSRQDGVFIQMSTLALAEVMTRVLPGSPTDDQIARYDAGTSAWVAEDLPAGSIQTFIADTDTPPSYTTPNAARYLLRVNGTPDGVEFIPEPANDNSIPHVSRLPVVADDSPVLVFLTHDENDGARQDATMTVGEALGRYCGYSNGDIFQAFGSLSRPSPIEMIFGIWDGTDCTIQTVHSANEGFIDDIRSVIFTVTGGTEMTCALGSAFQEYGYQTKRITSCTGLEDIGTVDVTINFLYADGTTAYWTDGTRAHRAGLYEKVGSPPTYHDLAPPEDAHRTGEGSAACGDANPPDAAGQVCVTSDGRGYFAMPRTSLVTTPATISVAGFGSGLFIPDIYTASQLENRNNLSDGDFLYIKATQEFYQFQDPDFEVVTWMEAWQYAIDNVGDTPIRQTFLTSTFLGEFASENEVLRDRDGHTTPLPAQATATVTGGTVTAIAIDYGGSGYMAAPTITIEAPGTGTTATATATITDGVVTGITITDAGSGYASAPDVTFSNPSGFIEYYFLYSDFGALIHIDEFTNSIRETITEGFAWRGPVIIPEEVLDIVEANPPDEIDEPLDSVLIGSQRYSVIVRPGSNGALRNPTAADYDSTYARSKVVAVVDGKPYKVRRTLVSGHTASGTFTEVAENTRLTAGGSGTFRWRGVYTADQNVSSPEEDDIYYNIQYHHWRIRDHDPAYGNYWYTLPNGGEILNRLMWVDYYTSETDALGHATANGQRFVLPDGSDWALYTLTMFTAAEGAHYEYSWTEAVPVPVLPANETLIDDQELEWASANKPSVEVSISRELVEADDGRAVLIDYRPNAAGDESRAAGGAILAEHVRHLTTLRPLMLQKMSGGRTAIDRTIDISNSPGSVEFPFPLSSGNNDLRWMRLHYIGDHIDDIDGGFDSTATTLTLDSTADIRTNTNYWMVGPTQGSDCGAVTNHSELVTVTAVGTPNPQDITVVRAVDGTDLPTGDCRFASAADFILDDKTTFTMVPTHDDQDSGDFTFTLLAQGAGAGGEATPAQPVSGGGILLQRHLTSSTTETTIDGATWVTVMTQDVTVAGATDRVYVDGLLSVEHIVTGTVIFCDIRVTRGGTAVGAESRSESYVSGEIHPTPIRILDTPGAGSHTYNIDMNEEATGTGNCNVNPDGTTSFATFDVLAANP